MSQDDGGGSKAEEAVRAFFLQSGYFVARGVKFTFDREEITDLDVWAYGRGSPTHRERVIVDCKYKGKRAQGLERILWVTGLQRVLGAEHAVVATTDGREQVRTLASKVGVRVIGPAMLDQLIDNNLNSQRLTDEEFFAMVIPREDKLTGRLRDRVQIAKSLLVSPDFGALNRHLDDIRIHVENSTKVQARATAIRLFYLSASFFLITLDFMVRDAAFITEQALRSRIEDGIRFGARGRAGTFQLLEDVGNKKKKVELLRAADAIPADILAEFFARHKSDGWLIDTAIELEAAAFNRGFLPVGVLPLAAQSVAGVLLDYLNVDRHAVFGVI